MAVSDFSSLKIGVNPVLNAIDLVVVAVGNGHGRLAIDRTAQTPILIALGTDRRAEADDVVPEMLTAAAGAVAPLFSRRGWVGDILLPESQRYGSRLWLLSRGKTNDGTRVAAADYAAQAVAPISDYHGVEIDTAARWYDRGRGILMVTASTLAMTVNLPVRL